MEIQQIRNATIIITYHNKRFLVDPWLMDKDYMAGFEAGINSEIRQPRENLPFSIDKITNVDAVILTHFHPDHWDSIAEKALNKNIKFFVQSKFDKNIIENLGFNNLEIISEKGTEFENIMLYKTKTQHGKREIIKPLCEAIGMPYDAMGVVFKSLNEKTLYIAGDTIYCKEFENAIDKFSPDITIINACGATLKNGEHIIMDIADIIKTNKYLKGKIIIASHMDNTSHLTVTRENIKSLNLENILIPKNGETMKF
jgi:L-ascorbate metabolism protein UlaG (beta-lactamase superfamily)